MLLQFKEFLIVSLYLTINIPTIFGNAIADIGTDDGSHMAPIKSGLPTVDHKSNVSDGSFNLIGFEPRDTVPVAFPLDICLMNVQGILYAVSIHLNAYRTRNDTSLTIFKRIIEEHNRYKYSQIFTSKSGSSQHMDCSALGANGYVVVVSHQDDIDSFDDVAEASLVYQITGDDVKVVQQFAMPNQNQMNLRKSAHSLFLLQSYMTNGSGLNENCPIYKWVDITFELLGRLPCMNAMRLEPFTINGDIFVVIANNRDEYGNNETDSFLYKFDVPSQQFKLYQKFRTSSARYVRYIKVQTHRGLEYFLMIANLAPEKDGKKMESYALVYKYIDGQFIAYQRIVFEHEIRQIVPNLGSDGEFALLIVESDLEVEVYQYDGKSFIPNDIQFTDGSFGRGVASLRVFNLNGEDLIVVANEEMNNDATNLYVPKYRYQNNRNRIPSNFQKWYTTMKEQMNDTNLEELAGKLKRLVSLKQQTNNDININGHLQLQNSTVNIINADSVNTSSLFFNEMIIRDNLLDAEKIIQTSLEDPSAQNILQSVNQQQHMKFDKLVIEQSVEVNFINGLPIDEFLFNNPHLHLSLLSVNDLVVQSNFELYEHLYAKLDRPGDLVRAARNSDQTIKIGKLHTEVLNGFKFSDIVEQSLKINLNEQTIPVDVVIDTLRVFQTHTQFLGGQLIDDIVRIDGGNFFIDQEIRFLKPVKANQLIINERLKEHVVENGVIQVLMLRSSRVQIISPSMTFESIKLLEPIILSGKIQSKNLDLIKPTVIIDEDIVVNGDFVITGDATVKNYIQALDIVSHSGNNSVRRLHELGISLQQTDIYSPLRFAREISVGNLVGNTTINTLAISNFVKTNIAQPQYVYAEKLFFDDLQIRNGFCHAVQINNIDLEYLNQTSLNKNYPSPIVTGTIYLNRLIVDKFEFGELKLANRLVQNLITTDTEQELTGDIAINGDLQIFGNVTSIGHLYSINNVFGVNLSSLVEDALQMSTVEDLTIRGEKWFDYITIDTAQFESNSLWHNGSTKEIWEQIESRQSDVVLNGPVFFQNDFHIDDLIFYDYLNEIHRSDFGKQWLLYETDQTFTAPVSVQDFFAEGQLILNGPINNMNFTTVATSSIKTIDESVYIKDIIFEQLHVQKSINLSGLYSNLRIPEDILLKYSATEQEFPAHIQIENSLDVDQYLTLDYLNGIPFEMFSDLLGESEGSNIDLVVNGQAYFSVEPSISGINGMDFMDLLTNVWFTTDTTVPLSNEMIIEEADFTNSISTITLNQYDVTKVASSYFSITRPQTINSFISVKRGIVFEKGIESKLILLENDIHTAQGNRLNLNEFFNDTLRGDVEHQIVRAPWFFDTIELQGNLESVLINGLNLNNDVVRYSQPKQNIINATKTFDSVEIESLNCRGKCTIQNVQVDQWMRDSVHADFNYTIQGETTLYNPIISSGVNLYGDLNGHPFNPNNILQKSGTQKITGNVYIGTSDSDTQNILPVTFDNVQIEYLNSILVDEYLQNYISKALYGPNTIALHSNVQFNQPLVVNQLIVDHDFYNSNESEILYPTDIQRSIRQQQDKLDGIEMLRQELKGKIQDSVKTTAFDEFMFYKNLAPNFIKILPIRFAAHQNGNLIMAVLNISNAMGDVSFYNWNTADENLVRDEKLLSIKWSNVKILDCFKFTMDSEDSLAILGLNKDTNQFMLTFFNYIQNDLKQTYTAEIGGHKNIISLNVTNLNCFGLFEGNQRIFAMKCMTLTATNQLKVVQEEQLITTEIHQAVSGALNWLVLHHANDEIGSWEHTESAGWILKETFKALHKIQGIAAIVFRSLRYIVVCSQGNIGSKSGYIDIYRNDYEIFGLIQTVELKETPLKCQLSIRHGRELMLFVLTDNTEKPFISLEYFGQVGFRQLELVGAQRVSVINQFASNIPLIQLLRFK